MLEVDNDAIVFWMDWLLEAVSMERWGLEARVKREMVVF